MDSALIPLLDYTGALDPAVLFPSPAPLEVDIGCGKGRFLAARASDHPEINFLGIDRLLNRLRRADKKILRGELTNVRLLRLEAAYTVARLLPPESVSMCHVLFPDPWPKRRHSRRRLFNSDFLDSLCAVFTPDGQLNLSTDDRAYFEEVHALFTADARFTEIPAFELQEKEWTNFEILFRNKGMTIRRCSFRKQ